MKLNGSEMSNLEIRWLQMDVTHCAYFLNEGILNCSIKDLQYVMDKEHLFGGRQKT